MTPELTLFQAEWCPYSASVRQLLTELGRDFVARQVPARREDRDEMRRLTGTDSIPVLQVAGGETFAGTDEIFAYLATLEPWDQAGAHRQRYRDHEEERRQGVTGRLVEGVRRGEPEPPSAAD
jgi:glutathione S-transferase